jgi:hypothetical protein
MLSRVKEGELNLHTLFAQVTTSTNVSGGGGIGAGIAGLVWLVIVVAMLVAIWKLFAKAGQPGWAALIPIYNYVVLFRITGRSAWWILGMFVPFLNIFVAIRLVFDLAKAFGRGVGFGFGLLFLFPIFVMILAFGDAQYVGHAAQPLATGGLAPAPLAP